MEREDPNAIVTDEHGNELPAPDSASLGSFRSMLHHLTSTLPKQKKVPEWQSLPEPGESPVATAFGHPINLPGQSHHSPFGGQAGAPAFGDGEEFASEGAKRLNDVVRQLTIQSGVPLTGSKMEQNVTAARYLNPRHRQPPSTRPMAPTHGSERL